MRISQAILAVMPVALAAPSHQLEARDPQDVHITFQVSRLTSEAAIEVWNKDQTEILGQSCTSSINSGVFQDSPIAFTVDERGAGSVTVGAKTYKIHENVDISGGISCGRITSAAEFMIDCVVPLSGAVLLAPLSKRNLANCFPEGPVELAEVMRGFATQPTLGPDSAAPPALEMPSNGTEGLSDIEKRQGCSTTLKSTERVGDGNPHQNPLHIQLSEVLHCTQNTCTIGYTTQKSYTIGFQASASVAGWIAGGFAVEKSVTTGTYSECNGGPGQYMAVWKKVAQTAYTVRNRYVVGCTAVTYSDNYVMWSPNTNNRGGEFYCVYGQQYVRAIGDRWLDTTGRAGGP